MANKLLGIFGAGAAATALSVGLMTGNALDDADQIVDLSLEKDGKAMMYVDGAIKAFDPEDARCADLGNCNGIEQFKQKAQQSLAAVSPEALQSAVGTYYTERRILNDVLDRDLPNALEHVNPAQPSTDDVIFIRQGLNDILNNYGALQSSDSYEVDPAHIQELTQLHDTLYNAEHAQQAYENFKTSVMSYDGFSAEQKQQITGALSGPKATPSPGKAGYPSF